MSHYHHHDKFPKKKGSLTSETIELEKQTVLLYGENIVKNELSKIGWLKQKH